jgi:hypothetical protein
MPKVDGFSGQQEIFSIVSAKASEGYTLEKNPQEYSGPLGRHGRTYLYRSYRTERLPQRSFFERPDHGKKHGHGSTIIVLMPKVGNHPGNFVFHVGVSHAIIIAQINHPSTEIVLFHFEKIVVLVSGQIGVNHNLTIVVTIDRGSVKLQNPNGFLDFLDGILAELDHFDFFFLGSGRF